MLKRFHRKTNRRGSVHAWHCLITSVNSAREHDGLSIHAELAFLRNVPLQNAWLLLIMCGTCQHVGTGV